MLSGNFYGSEIWHGIFLGLHFRPGIFFGFYLNSDGFFFFSVAQRHDGCVSCTLRPINAKKIAPVLHIMFRGQLVA